MSGFHGLPAAWRYVACPRCEAQPFMLCQVLNMARKWPHIERERAAEEAIAKGNETIFNEENEK